MPPKYMKSKLLTLTQYEYALRCNLFKMQDICKLPRSCTSLFAARLQEGRGMQQANLDIATQHLPSYILSVFTHFCF